MHVKIFKARTPQAPGKFTFLVVPIEKNADSVPANIRNKLGELVEFKCLDIKPGEKRIGANVDKILRQIDEKGYAIQRTEVNIREYAMGDI